MEKLEINEITVTFSPSDIGKYYIDLDELKVDQSGLYEGYYIHEIKKLLDLGIQLENYKIGEVIIGMCDRLNSTNVQGCLDGYELHLLRK